MMEAYERIDLIASLDLAERDAVGGLLGAAHDRIGGPVYKAAAEALAGRVAEREIVMIASGWHDRQAVNSRIAETDGPPGAVALARSLAEGLGVTPIIATDENLVDEYERLLMTAGIRPVPV